MYCPCHLQATRLRREAQKLRDLEAARDGLAARVEELRQELATALQRAERAEGEAANLKVCSKGGGAILCAKVPPVLGN